MFSPNILMISSDKLLLGSLKEGLHGLGGGRIDVVRTIDQACKHLGLVHPCLVVLHLGRSCRYETVDRLLWAASVEQHPVPVLVIADRYRADQATQLFRMGVSEYLSRMHHLDRLDKVLGALVPQCSSVRKSAQRACSETGEPKPRGSKSPQSSPASLSPLSMV